MSRRLLNIFGESGCTGKPREGDLPRHPSVAAALAMALGAVLATRMLDISKRIAVL